MSSTFRLAGRGLVFPGLLAAGLLAALAGCSTDERTGPEVSGYHPDTILVSVEGFPPMEVPDDNPVTRQGVDLGRRLFYDPVLSGDNTQSCASCHTQAFSFSDHGRRFSLGIDHTEGTRNAPALVNVGWNRSFFVDGRALSLESQALQPVENEIEMHETWPHAVGEIRDNPAYPSLFEAAFGDTVITKERVVQAIAQFERTFISSNSHFDRYLRDPVLEPLTDSEYRGYVLFFTDPVVELGKGGGDCFHCHSGGSLFTDNAFHNTGLDASPPDPGRMAVTGNAADEGKFRTPTVRNIAFSAPYMHDGRFNTLEEVVRHYNSGGVASPTVDPLIRTGGRTLLLTEQDIQDLVAFLLTLSDSSYLTNPDYVDPLQ